MRKLFYVKQNADPFSFALHAASFCITICRIHSISRRSDCLVLFFTILIDFSYVNCKSKLNSDLIKKHFQ